MNEVAVERRVRADRVLKPGNQMMDPVINAQEAVTEALATPLEEITAPTTAQMALDRARDLVRNMGDETLRNLGESRVQTDKLMLNVRNRQASLIAQIGEFADSCSLAIRSNDTVARALKELQTYFPETKTINGEDSNQ